MRLNWQNLNELPGDRHDATGSPIMHGRAWLEFGGALTIAWSWNFKSTFCHLRFSVDGDEGQVGGSIAFPPVALWIHFGGRLMQPVIRFFGCDYKSNAGRDVYGMGRSIEASIHHWAFWGKLWAKDGSWSRDDPWWMHWHLDFPDLILGRFRHTEEVLESRDVTVPMPEGGYAGVAKFLRETWTRPRWPRWPSRIVLTRAHLDVPAGIPVPGKGENSWDCGPDASYGLTCPADSIEDGIGKMVSGVLRDRRRRGAPEDYAERDSPAPAAVGC